ncbi:response regulator transcription factor [Variovorax sp. M-6]|uniref:response regulator transcription factor n=1 Tax=Variovorax sp. M-6 TaxID=3233041 RepID=UPI003F9930D0
MNNVMIVEDHRFVAEATEGLLRSTPGVGKIAIYGTADDVMSALAVECACWTLILLDLDVPGATGLSLAASIKEAGLAAITCILTGTYCEDYARQVKEQGFLGYILKASPTIELAKSLELVLAHKPVFPALGGADAARGRISLTRRQKEVLQLVARGLMSKEIARQLNVTPGTVDNHITAAAAVLGARTRSEAVSKALPLGLISSAA